LNVYESHEKDQGCVSLLNEYMTLLHVINYTLILELIFIFMFLILYF
jgi:hypothetical protein